MASALVTGGSRGIGLATCVSLARAGLDVVATMRRPDRSSELADVAAREGLPIEIVAMDVDSDESVRDTIGRIIAARGTPDALVNNAGIERHGSVEELPLSDFRAVMETNYFGLVRCIKAVLPAMRERGSGCIVNLSSVAGRISSSPLGPYTASKHAVEALSEALAQEVKAFGIRVAIVEPGIIGTDMARDVMGTDGSLYPHGKRMAALFAFSLKSPTPPEAVADQIREIVTGDSWRLRYPVGTDAVRNIPWRQSMSDEAWIDRAAMDDDAWYADMETRLGVDIRL